MDKRKIVFISYSWDSEEHKDWVLKLSNDLRSRYGIDVILDQYDISLGNDLNHFMESSILKADKIIVILTPEYKRKAENRERGVGYEISMITQEILEASIEDNKVIPIIRNGSKKLSTPIFLKSKLYLSMVKNDLYLNDLFTLAMTIYGKPNIEKPLLGEIPDFNDSNIDPIVDMANQITTEEKARKKIDDTFNSRKGVELFKTEVNAIKAELANKIHIYNNNTDLDFDTELNHRNKIILTAEGYSVTFEHNLLYNDTLRDSCLIVEYWKGHYKLLPGYQKSISNVELVERFIYVLGIDENDSAFWKEGDNTNLTKELIQKAFLFLVQKIRNEKLG